MVVDALVREVVGDENIPPVVAEGDEKADTYTGYILTIEAMRTQHAKEKAEWTAKSSGLEQQLADSELNAGKTAEAAQMCSTSAQAAQCSAANSESLRKVAEAKFEAAKAELEEQKLRVEASSERISQLTIEAQALKARAEKAEAADGEAAKGVREALQERTAQVADLQDKLHKLKQGGKAAVAEKEQLQKEMKNFRDQQKSFQKRFDEDDAEKKRLLQQATNAKLEVERLKKEARYCQQLEAEGAKQVQPVDRGQQAKGKKAQPDTRASSKDRGVPDRGRASSKDRGVERGRTSSKDRAPAFERAASYEPTPSCPEYDQAERPLSARGAGGLLSAIFGRG